LGDCHSQITFATGCAGKARGPGSEYGAETAGINPAHNTPAALYVHQRLVKAILLYRKKARWPFFCFNLIPTPCRWQMI
jgi:hypothetical protein